MRARRRPCLPAPLVALPLLLALFLAHLHKAGSCCGPATRWRTALAAAAAAGAGRAAGSHPVWTSHYLLSNSSVRLEPCGAPIPRAWRGAGRHNGPGLALPGTAVAQRLLWRHQNPVDCSNAKLFIYQPPDYVGLGALIDFVGDALARAVAEERVLLLDFPSKWTQGGRKSYCHGGALALDECFLEPVSSCSLLQVYGSKVVAAWAQTHDVSVLDAARKQLHGERLHFSAVSGVQEFNRVPPQMAHLLDGILRGGFVASTDSELHWFRSQAAAYLWRPNARTLQMLRELRGRFFRGQNIAPGTISVHVRRGDKAARGGMGEMEVVDDATYMGCARALADAVPDLQHLVFLSTEDPRAVEEFVANMTGWGVQFTSVPRTNHGGGKQPFAHAPTVEALRALFNLDLALECDAWVGTLTSFWSVLSERLRATVRCKADRPYADGHDSVAGLAWTADN